MPTVGRPLQGPWQGRARHLAWRCKQPAAAACPAGSVLLRCPTVISIGALALHTSCYTGEQVVGRAQKIGTDMAGPWAQNGCGRIATFKPGALKRVRNSKEKTGSPGRQTVKQYYSAEQFQ